MPDYLDQRTAYQPEARRHEALLQALQYLYGSGRPVEALLGTARAIEGYLSGAPSGTDPADGTGGR